MSPPERPPRPSAADDLAADLRSEVSRPTPLPTAPPSPPLPDVPTAVGTPALTMRFTPLRWQRPGFGGAEQGPGLSLRWGPVRVELAF